MKVRLRWILAAILLGLDSALLPLISLRWYLLYPFPAIPMLFWLSWMSKYETHLRYGQCLAFLVGPALFFLSSPSLLLGKARLSKRTFWTLLALTFLDIATLLFTWRDGYKYVPGERYTNLTIIGSCVWLSVVWLLFRVAKRRQSYWTIFAYHFVFALWLLTNAFPWFGEMP